MYIERWIVSVCKVRIYVARAALVSSAAARADWLVGAGLGVYGGG